MSLRARRIVHTVFALAPRVNRLKNALNERAPVPLQPAPAYGLRRLNGPSRATNKRRSARRYRSYTVRPLAAATPQQYESSRYLPPPPPQRHSALRQVSAQRNPVRLRPLFIRTRACMQQYCVGRRRAEPGLRERLRRGARIESKVNRIRG